MVTWYVKERDGRETRSVREETASKVEADALVAYLSTAHNETCEVEAYEFGKDECVNRTVLYRDATRLCGGCYSLCDESGYNLPFKVWGFFDFDKAEDITHQHNGIKLVAHVIGELGIDVGDCDAEKIGKKLRDNGFGVELCTAKADREEIDRREEEAHKRAEEERKRAKEGRRIEFEKVAARCEGLLKSLPDLQSLTIGDICMRVEDGKFVERSESEIPF